MAHTEARVGTPKVASAAAAMAALNPLVQVHVHAVRVDQDNVAALIAPYDIVCDGTDNFPARFLLADAAWRAGKTLISAAVLRYEGQLSTFRPGTGADGAPNPCYRCLYPAPPPPGLVPSCAEAGVLGPVTGVMGTLQATEVLKELLGIGEGLAGRLLIWDALSGALPHRAPAGGPGLPVLQDAARRSANVTHPPLDAGLRKRPTRTSVNTSSGEPNPWWTTRPNGTASPLGILLIAGTHERAQYAFLIAAAAASLGRPVVLFATNHGCRALA